MKPSTRRMDRTDLWAFLFIAILAWIVRYWFSSRFGLYEDDLTRIPHAISLSNIELIQLLGGFLFGPLRQGRLLHPFLIYIVGSTIGKIGGLQFLYFAGFAIYSLNGFLLYKLIQRVSNQSFGLLVAVSFILYPADTTQVYLTHSFGVQPSLTFLLLASHVYLSNRKICAYLLALGCLLTYETTFLVFLGVPLLKQRWNSDLKKEMVRHSTILIFILLAIAGIRILIGEGRLTGLSITSVPLTLIRHALLGPLISIVAFVYRPVEVILNANAPLYNYLSTSSPLFSRLLEISRLDGSVLHHQGMEDVILKAIFISIPFVFAFLSIFRLQKISPSEFPITNDGLHFFFWKLRSHEKVRIFQLVTTGLLMLMLSYPLSVTIPAFSIRGRNTRVHFAAVVGASIIFGVLLHFVLSNLKGSRSKFFVRVGLTIFIALLIGSSFLIQLDYVNAWEYQRAFWNELLPLIYDAKEGTTILVEPSGLVDSWQIGANVWNLPRMLDQLYDFPDEWKEPPRVYRLIEGWEENILENGAFVLNESTTVAPRSTYKRAHASNVILIGTASGQMSRFQGSMMINGEEILLNQQSESKIHPFPKGILFSYIIDN